MATLVVGSADARLIETWDQNLNICQQARLNFERQWHENMAFFFGRQWIVTTKNPQGGFMIREMPAQEPWRVRHTSNRILRIIRTEIAKLSKEEPQFFCMPSSSDEKDRLAAMAGDAIAEWIIRTKYFNRKRTEATLWASLCGTSFLKNYYDEAKLELDGRPGKIAFEAVTPFHLFVKNLQVVDIEEQPFVIHARTLDPNDVYMFYGVEIDPDADSASTIIDSRFLSTIGIKTGSSSKQCYVKEVYVKPCKEHPKGAFFVYGGGQILYVKEELPEQEFAEPPVGIDGSETVEIEEGSPVGFNPDANENVIAPKSIHEGGESYEHTFAYRHGRFPFAKIDHIPTGMFYSESVIKSLMSPQKEYNRTRSIMLEHRNMAGKPQWYHTGGSFDTKKWNSKPGLLLQINMGFEPPRPLEQPPLPPTVSNELEVILRDMDDISSQYEITKGRTPPGVEAASAIAYLSEENDSILAPTIQSLEAAVQETGIQVLANVHDYWDENRIVKMTSQNHYLEVRQFKAADLNPIMDFRVEAGSMAPRSTAAKQAFITELMKMGVITPEQGLKYLQMSETNKMYEDLMLDTKHAQRENVYMSMGQKLTKPDPTKPDELDPNTGMPIPSVKMASVIDPVTGMDQVQTDPMTGQSVPVMVPMTINPFDSHEIHIREHQNFQKTQEYELLPPEIQQIIQDHVDEHKMEMIKEKLVVQKDQAMNGGEEIPPPRELESAGQPSGPS